MCASFNDLENCGGNGAIPVDHHDTLDDDEIPNLLDYLEEFDAESDPNNDNSCFSVLQSLVCICIHKGKCWPSRSLSYLIYYQDSEDLGCVTIRVNFHFTHAQNVQKFKLDLSDNLNKTLE